MRSVLLGIVLLASLAAPVTAQNVSDRDGRQTSDSINEEPALEVIDNSTAIESAQFVKGEMRIVLISDSLQRIVITDAGAVLAGGEVPQRSVRLQKGRNLVTIPVTQVGNLVVVTIATRDVLYSVPVETSEPLIGGPFDRGDVQQAALAGLVAGVGVTALIAYKRVRGTPDSPERVI